MAKGEISSGKGVGDSTGHLSWDAPKHRPQYRIFVRDLVLPALIGIHPPERDKPQRLCINLDIKADDDCARAKDDIANVVSYEDIVEGVKSLLSRGHVGLLETLAEKIANMCLVDRRVRVVRVRLEKFDVFDEAKSVGIEIERSAKSRSSRVDKVIAFEPVATPDSSDNS